MVKPADENCSATPAAVENEVDPLVEAKACCREAAHCTSQESGSQCPLSEPSSTLSEATSPPDDAGHSARVTLNVVYRKRKYHVDAELDTTVASLKEQLHPIIDVPPAMQKLMIRGLAADASTLRQLGVAAGAKVMVVGSTLNDVLSVATPGDKEEASSPSSSSSTTSEKLCDVKMHRKILDKGVPEDAMPGYLNVHEPLPPVPLSGMLNRAGSKVRLTFKLETDHLWIGTRERTEKLAMSSVKTVVSEPITGHERYHIMGIQLGPTEASRYWLYWVPAQYVNAIKDAVLGKWQYF